jgi:hypothetical protein
MRLKLPTVTEPADPPSNSTRGQQRIWEKRIDDFVRRELVLTENVKTAYSLIWGQCTDVMRQKLEGQSDYDSVEEASDAIGLLKGIKSNMFNFQGHFYLPQALRDAKRRFYFMTQDKP